MAATSRFYSASNPSPPASFREIFNQLRPCSAVFGGDVSPPPAASATGEREVYGVFTVSPYCPASMSMATMLLRAEDAMQQRLKEAGYRLQVVVVEHQATNTVRNGKSNFRELVEGLRGHHWKAVAADDERGQALLRTALADRAKPGPAPPSLALLDGRCRVLLESGAHHLAVDRQAIGFPWVGSLVGKRRKTLQHLVAPTMVLRAIQSARLVTLLICRPIPDSALSVSDMWALLDSYGAAARDAVEQYSIPAGDAAFFYSMEQSTGLSSLLRVAKMGGPPFMVEEVRSVLSSSPACLLVMWKDGSGKISYSLAGVDGPDNPILCSHFFASHPSLRLRPLPGTSTQPQSQPSGNSYKD